MIDYTPLMITLAKKHITKTILRKGIGLSSATLAKIAKNETISLEVIERICKYLDCNIEDVVTIIH